ncbi:MAG TPA: hypothetical protein VMF32_13565, partial [Xanthobacteraceae bacterium]|nr:hypothetical protein [Xanthobacteraceae bacterium]
VLCLTRDGPGAIPLLTKWQRACQAMERLKLLTYLSHLPPQVGGRGTSPILNPWGLGLAYFLGDK